MVSVLLSLCPFYTISLSSTLCRGSVSFCSILRIDWQLPLVVAILEGAMYSYFAYGKPTNQSGRLAYLNLFD